MVEEDTAVGLEEASTDEEELSEEENLMAKLKEPISVKKEDIGS